jgi:hypothetical protein
VVKLYKHSFKGWQYQNILGAIVLHRDDKGIFSFRIVDLVNNKGVLWDTPLKKEFDYVADRPFFHTFPVNVSFYQTLQSHHTHTYKAVARLGLANGNFFCR